MSKTIDAQIEKSDLLIEGFRKHIKDLREWGVEEADLDAMSESLKKLKTADEACAELRQELSKRVKVMNDILADARSHYLIYKRLVKENFPQETWQQYGVFDKR